MGKVDMSWYTVDTTGYHTRRMKLALPQPRLDGAGLILEKAGEGNIRLMLDTVSEGKWYSTQVVLSPHEVQQLVSSFYELSLE
jgi:hypothetical protein